MVVDGYTSYFAVGVDPSAPAKLYVSALRYAPPVLDYLTFTSDDHGDSWTELPANAFGEVRAIAVDHHGTVYFGGSTVWKSDDGGLTFRSVSLGLGTTITSIAFDPSDENTIYAGAGNAIYKTTSGGD